MTDEARDVRRHGQRDRRATFGPVVLVGLAAGALAAVSGAKVWVEEVSSKASAAGQVKLIDGSGPGHMPLAAALAYLLLATWGVLLVTRGRVRRVLAGVGVLVSLGYVACVVVGAFTLRHGIEDRYASLMKAGQDVPTSFTGWYWVAAVAAVLSVVATVLAVRLVRAWPEMGTRYDAPAGDTTHAPVDPEDADTTSLELWKSIDDGDDPTLTR